MPRGMGEPLAQLRLLQHGPCRFIHNGAGHARSYSGNRRLLCVQHRIIHGALFRPGTPEVHSARHVGAIAFEHNAKVQRDKPLPG